MLEKAQPRTLAIALVAITFVCFLPSLDNGFTVFDDPLYITENDAIRSIELERYFTETFVGNYQPLTILTYAIEYSITEAEPFLYHLDNLLLHLLNTWLVFLFIRLLVGNLTVAFVVALMFGIHPMHVESVAWASQRKDVLYSAFYLGAMVTYMNYRWEEGGRKMLIYTLLLFAGALLSKGQAVVLPVTLLLIDWYKEGKLVVKDVIGKVPMFTMSVAAGLLAINAQGEAGAFQDFDYFTVGERLLFGSYGFISYFPKLLAPVRLSVFYPYPVTNDEISSMLVYAAPVIILAILAIVVWSIRKTNVIAFGMGFFVVHIVLVLQFIPFGDAIMADRYTYMAGVGWFFILAMGLDSLMANEQYKQVAMGLGVVVLGWYGYLTYERAQVWESSLTLFTDAVAKNPEVPITRANKGVALFEVGRYQESLQEFEAVIKLRPSYPKAFENRAIMHMNMGNTDAAIADFSEAIARNPDFLQNYLNRLNLNRQKNDLNSALVDLQNIVRLQPNNIDARFQLGEVLGRTGRLPEAITQLSTVISMNSEYLEGYNNRGIAYSLNKEYEKAIVDFTEYINRKTDNADVWANRSLAYRYLGRYEESLQDLLKAQELGMKIDPKAMQSLVEKVQ